MQQLLIICDVDDYVYNAIDVVVDEDAECNVQNALDPHFDRSEMTFSDCCMAVKLPSRCSKLYCH